MNSTIHDKNQAEIGKLLAETVHIHKKARWYELVLFGGFIIGLLAAGKYLL